MAEKSTMKPGSVAEAEVLGNLASLLQAAAITDEPHEHSGESDRLLRIAATLIPFFIRGHIKTDSENFGHDLAALVRASRLVPGDTESDERRALLKQAEPILASLTEVDADEVIKPPADRPPLHRNKRGPWAEAQALACAWSEQTNNLHRLIEAAAGMLEGSADRTVPLATLRTVLDVMRESPAEHELLGALPAH